MSWIVRVRCAAALSEPVTTLAIIHNTTGIAETTAPNRDSQIEVLAGFDDYAHADSFAAAAADFEIESTSVQTVSSEDWAQTHTSTVTFGGATLHLEVGTAFGHGAHPTTALALAALAHLRVTPASSTLLDVGCGTGVLSIAAAVQGFTATGCDVDPEAVAIATRNAQRNRVAATVSFVAASPTQLATPQWIRGSTGFSVIVANTLIGVHESEAAAIQALASPTATLIISGLLNEHVSRARAAYPSFELTSTTTRDQWVLLQGARR
ncbi:MAG: methyltransferase domain-containing protein [Acidimicrobiales bacterium]|nr:methyltransferase domain-containing protein [Acidimicrobiales bacterium]